MQTSIIAGAIFAGVLAVALPQPGQSAQEGISGTDFYNSSAILSVHSQLSERQWSDPQGGKQPTKAEAVIVSQLCIPLLLLNLCILGT
jgi:hypothetical protein